MMTVIVALPDHKFISAERLNEVRAFTAALASDDGMLSIALMLQALVTDIDNYREAFKGATVIVNDASRIAALAQMKASVLLGVAEKVRPVLDDEIEQRKAGGNAEDWAELQSLSDELHAAIRLVSR